MNKILLSVFIFLLVSIASCQQAAKEPVMEKKEDVMQKTETPTAATGDASVDAVGKDLNSIDSVEKDLGTDDLSDLDSGLSDIQNI